MKNYADYHVALKILLRRGDDYLFLRCSKTDHPQHLDLPGGRIDVGEEDKSFADILSREIVEELGENLKYKLGVSQFQFRRFFPTLGYKIFLTVFDGEYLEGDISLSDEHDETIWINPNAEKLKREQFLNDEEFEAFRTYFQK